MDFQDLPVELIAEVFSELDLQSLVTVSYISKRIYLVASDSSLNPWRRPIHAHLRDNIYDSTLKHLSVRSTVPRQNWIEILTLARPSFLLFDATLPNLKSNEWEECFRRRFPPSWLKWRKDGAWKEVFLKVLYRVWHRGTTSCTTDEAWTKYIVLNRNGSANELEITSRNFNPLAIFHELKVQNNLAHLETRVWNIVDFVDFRILAFGTMAKPNTPASVNINAHMLLNPPGMEPEEVRNSPMRQYVPMISHNAVDDHGVYPVAVGSNSPVTPIQQLSMSTFTYNRLNRPCPAAGHSQYPFHTPGGADSRWVNYADVEEGYRWVGSLMVVAQILGPPDSEGISHARHYCSFEWCDLWTIAPWLDEIITSRVDGQGLGH
ncbi:hypothetical protein DFP72DRAFT_878332 [Ephemerocybe angulata]|uniref:F-box domain-containing protein n=1 Tax=Ephemerocybe angulata TaxID=980116 RepID=A0A8H6IB23_9AGAR|nr:hypothetical protein DFP72DRAFT_878332 [Tulosesus angulatus]